MKSFIPVARPWLPPLKQYQALLKDIWRRKMLSNFNKYAQRFEKRGQAYLRNKNARVVASCDLGLIIAIKALGLKEGRECIVPSFTFQSTVNAVIWNGLTPKFVDVDPETFNIDPLEIEKNVSNKTVLIIGTHTFGNPCRIDHLQQLARAKNIPLIFDAAQAFGSLYQGKKIGNFGDCEVFSFSGTKLITSAEGGLVSVRSKTMAEKIEHLREYGFRNDYNARYVGINAKISELHAALGTLSIDALDNIIKRYQQIVSRYKKNLAAIPEITFQKVDSKDRSTYKDFAIVCRRGRDQLLKRLAEMNIQCKTYFFPVHLMKAFHAYSSRRLKNTENLQGKILCVPIYSEMKFKTADMICEIIDSFYKKK